MLFWAPLTSLYEQNIKKYSDTGLERHEAGQIMTEFSFWGKLSPSMNWRLHPSLNKWNSTEHRGTKWTSIRERQGRKTRAAHREKHCVSGTVTQSFTLATVWINHRSHSLTLLQSVSFKSLSLCLLSSFSPGLCVFSLVLPSLPLCATALPAAYTVLDLCFTLESKNQQSLYKIYIFAYG